MADGAELILTEVLPGIAVVTGEVPDGLDLIDLGIIPAADRERIAAVLASVGNASTVAGNIGNAMTSVQGLFRVNEATAALLRGGATLVAKDGANLGTIMQGGKIVAQARFIPVAAANAATVAAAIGPAVAMIAVQMQLGEISRLTRLNVARTTQVLGQVRAEQWSTLTGLVEAVDHILDEVREVGAFTQSAADAMVGKESDLLTQIDLYQGNVAAHVRQLDAASAHEGRREYLEANAEAIIFDAFALLQSLKAWTGYQAIRAGRARALGATDPHEAAQSEVIARNARAEFDTAIQTASRLVDALSRELNIIAELPGRATLPLTRHRRSAKSARLTCATLIEALQPLTEVLHPGRATPEPPSILAVHPGFDVDQAVRILQWHLEDGEAICALAVAFEPGGDGAVTNIGRKTLQNAKFAIDGVVRWDDGTEIGAASLHANTVVAVTDRRVLQTGPGALTKRGKVQSSVPLDAIRYVRAGLTADGSVPTSVDVITRLDNFRWIFHASVNKTAVGALAAVLAEAMTLPDVERAALLGLGAVKEIEVANDALGLTL